MKLCKAWPDMCTKSEVDKVDAKVDKVDLVDKDERVWPKALVDAAVDRSVESLLKISKSEEEDLEDPKMPVQQIIKKKKKSVKVAKKSEIHDLKQILYALGILGIIILGFLYTLFERVSSLEVWLHGRLRTSH